jgi:hypothetical protein
MIKAGHIVNTPGARPKRSTAVARPEAEVSDRYTPGSEGVVLKDPRDAFQSGSALPTAEEILKTPYEDRLKTLIQLGERFPGVKEHDPDKDDPLAGLGVFAGLYMQTSWQKRSGRDESAFWSILNHSLTKYPEKFAKEYEAGKFVAPSKPRSDGKLTENDVRQAWHSFFKASDAAQARPLRPGNAVDWVKAEEDHPQKALWDAHCKSLHFFKQEYGDYLAAHKDPETEDDLEQSWFNVVDYLAEVNFPTTSKYAEPILSHTMPEGGILGKDTKLGDLGGTKFLFSGLMVGLSGLITRMPAKLFF